MYELISNLILYGNLPEDEILVQLAKLLSDDEKSNHELRQGIYGQIKRLLELELNMDLMIIYGIII